MALIAAHLNAGVILVLTVERQVYNLPLPPPPYPFPLLPVPNKPYGQGVNLNLQFAVRCGLEFTVCCKVWT